MCPLALTFALLASGCGEKELALSTGEALRGHVLDGLGEPLRGARVSAGKDIVTTDARGEFTIESVSIPYDLVVVPEEHDPSYYVGLTSTEPVLELAQARARETHRHIDLTWHDEAEESKTVSTVQALEVRAAHGTDARFEQSANSAERWFFVEWAVDVEAVLHGYAFRYEQDPVTHEPIRYLAYAEIERTIHSGQDERWDVEWKPFPFEERTVELETSMPTDYGAQASVAFYLGDAKHAAASAGSWSIDGRASLVLPVVPGLRFEAVAVGSSTETSVRTSEPDLSGDSAQLSIDDGPKPLSPADGAKNMGPGTTLSWTSDAPGVVTLWPVKPDANAPTLYLYTGASSIEIPNLARLGIRLPQHTKYSWFVATGAPEVVDDLAAIGLPYLGSRYATTHDRTLTTR